MKKQPCLNSLERRILVGKTFLFTMAAQKKDARLSWYRKLAKLWCGKESSTYYDVAKNQEERDLL